jgi:hypothetical protein
MKRALTICGLFCALMIGVAAVSAQKGANFAGTWELDKAKSILAGPLAESLKSATWIVTQDDKQLTRGQKIDAGGPGIGTSDRGLGLSVPLTVKLDGSETTTESEYRKTVSKAKWLNDGKTLKIIDTSTFRGQNGEFMVTTTEHWELADDGKTLKVHRKTENLHPSESTWVLTKK